MSKIKINSKEAVTSRLGFKPFAQFDDLCYGRLTKVEVTESEIKETSNWEYKGLTVPRLSFEFIQHKLSKADPDRFYGFAELPIANIKSDGTDITDESLLTMYTEMWRRIKHIHDQYTVAPNFKAIDFDPEFDTGLSIDKRVESFKTFFTKFADAFNKGTDGKPIYLVEGDDTAYGCAMKLIASGNKKSYLAFPNFVGKGFIQRCGIKSGKLDTTLEFRANEGIELGGSALAQPMIASVGGAAGDAGMSDELMAKVLGNQ